MSATVPIGVKDGKRLEIIGRDSLENLFFEYLWLHSLSIESFIAKLAPALEAESVGANLLARRDT